MKFLIFLFHVISIYSIIAWVYQIYFIGKNKDLYLLCGLRESERITLKIKFSVGAIYILYWVFKLIERWL